MHNPHFLKGLKATAQTDTISIRIVLVGFAVNDSFKSGVQPNVESPPLRCSERPLLQMPSLAPGPRVFLPSVLSETGVHWV